MGGKVIVRGTDFTKAPLLKSNDVKFIEIYDSEGQLMALLIWMVDDVWGMVDRDDPAWNEICMKYGYAKTKEHISLDDMLNRNLDGKIEIVKGFKS